MTFVIRAGEVAEPASVVSGGTGAQIAQRGIDFTDGYPQLVGSRCIACSAVAWPPSPRCHVCWLPTATIALATTGTLYAFSRVHAAPPGWAVPYIVGYVDFAEGARVFARIEDTPGLQIDGMVELHAAQSEDGIEFWFGAVQ